jgi:hypothetical protein
MHTGDEEGYNIGPPQANFPKICEKNAINPIRRWGWKKGI